MSISEKEQTRIAIPGRFKPFHKGHLSVVEAAACDSRFDEIIIPVCGQAGSYTERDFLTFEENKIAIQKSTQHITKLIHVIQTDDIEDPQNWVSYLVSKLPKFQFVLSNNPDTRDLFKQSGFAVECATPVYQLSATLVRNLMVKEVFEKKKSWHDLVPEGTRVLLESIKGDQRLARIILEHPRPILTGDLIVPVIDFEHIAMVKRKHPPYAGRWAHPGGHRNQGERLKDTALREALEELIDPDIVDLKPDNIYWLGLFDTPNRDPRGDYVSHVYYTDPVPLKSLRADSDAQSFDVFSIYDLPDENRVAFDHSKMTGKFIQDTAHLRREII